MAIEAVLALAGSEARMIAHGTIPTLNGTREQLTLSFAGENAVLIGEAFLAELPDHAFDVPGHQVVSAKSVWVHRAEGRIDMQVELLVLDTETTSA